MKKKLMGMLLAGLLVCSPSALVFATELTEEGTAAGEVVEDTGAGETGEMADTTTEVVENEFAINPDNYVDVEVLDLSLHGETSGDFTPVYAYENPFLGKDTSKGVVFEFYVKPTWEVHELGTIFAIVGTGDYDGRIYFTPGSYLGYNSGLFGGYYDANLYNYTIVTDYIQAGAKIRIELLPTGFAVYANDQLCYDQTILDDETRAAGDYKGDSDFSPVLTWLSGAQTLYFGYGSWWNAVGNEANVNLSEVNFRLMDGTVVMNKLQADKVLIEKLGGSVDLKNETAQKTEIKLADVNVEIFDIKSVKYEGSSVLPAMGAVVAVVAVAALAIVLVVTKKRTYPEE